MNDQGSHPGASPSPLAELVREVEQNNPEVAAALHTWQAATNVPKQVSALPDAEVTVQQFSVGSPRPFAGYSNSDFAYIGIGASQDLPYPGKRRLRSEVPSETPMRLTRNRTCEASGNRDIETHVFSARFSPADPADSGAQ